MTFEAKASSLIESLRGDLAKLREAGAIDAAVQRAFDAVNPPPARAPSDSGNENPGSGPGWES